MRVKGSRWLHDDIYFFVWSLEGNRVFHGEIPEGEGKNVRDLTDILGKPIGRMFLDIAASPEGEGWLHCMWPRPYDVFPAWKSCFVQRVTFPSGRQYLVGSGIYNMQADKPLIEDVVNRAAALVAEKGQEAFDVLRDKKGPFYFMDTFVFVDSPEGVELVNGGMPSLEGRNLRNERDLRGKQAVRDYIDAALEQGSAWVDYYWYKPGENTPSHKHTFVRKVQHGNDTYIVGAGLYLEEVTLKQGQVRKLSWETIEKEKLTDILSRQVIFGEKGTLARLLIGKGAQAPQHAHVSEEYFIILSGSARISCDGRETVAGAGDIVVIPPNVPHAIVALQDTEAIDFFAPRREDWLQGRDQYLRS